MSNALGGGRGRVLRMEAFFIYSLHQVKVSFRGGWLCLTNNLSACTSFVISLPPKWKVVRPRDTRELVHCLVDNFACCQCCGLKGERDASSACDYIPRNTIETCIRLCEYKTIRLYNYSWPWPVVLLLLIITITLVAPRHHHHRHHLGKLAHLSDNYNFLRIISFALGAAATSYLWPLFNFPQKAEDVEWKNNISSIIIKKSIVSSNIFKNI